MKSRLVSQRARPSNKRIQRVCQRLTQAKNRNLEVIALVKYWTATQPGSFLKTVN